MSFAVASGDSLAIIGPNGSGKTLLFLLVVGFVWRARSRLVLALISPDMARTAGVEVARLDLLFLLAFALTVALGLRYLGVLPMGR